MNNKCPKVSVVILNYNTYSLTIKEVINIDETIHYDGLEIIIVDNNSTNDSVSQLNTFIRNWKGNFKVILLKSLTNGGYAAGNNIGIKESIRNKSDYTLIVNNDIIFTDAESISQLVNYLELNQNVGVVSPRIISLDGTHDKPIYYKKPSFWDLSFGLIQYRRGISCQNDEEVYEVYAPRGSCMMLRNDDLKKIRLLDEGTFLYYEEPILAESLAILNKTAVNYGLIGVIHNHAETIKSNIPNKNIRKYLIQSLNYYLIKYRGFNYFQVCICKIIRKYAFLFK